MPGDVPNQTWFRSDASHPLVDEGRGSQFLVRRHIADSDAAEIGEQPLQFGDLIGKVADGGMGIEQDDHVHCLLLRNAVMANAEQLANEVRWSQCEFL